MVWRVWDHREGLGQPGLGGVLGFPIPFYLSIRSELELVFEGSPDWVCCFSCDLANFSAAAMGHPDKLWEKERKKREQKRRRREKEAKCES